MKISRAAAGMMVLSIALVAPQAQAQALSAEEANALRAELAALKARLDALENRMAASDEAAAKAQAEAKAQAANNDNVKIDWKGGTRFTEGDRSFKMKGRIQMDANHVSAPKGLNDKGLGFSNEARRVRVGGEGKLGGGFGYKLEAELSDNSVDLIDAFVTYEKGDVLVTLGNQNQFQSLDELISDTQGSVMERAAFTDAFNFERRLGLSVQYKKGALLAQGGIFTDDVAALSNSSDGPNGGDENNSYSLDGRIVFAPKLGDTQLHLAGSAHWRHLNRIADAGVRYRQRPFVHSTNTRLLDTRTIDADREFSYGAELAAVHGRWHGVVEGHWLRANRLDGPNPSFWGGYAEIGYYLTDDTRPYENGIFGTAKPSNPVGKGGIGAVQLNLRYDYLDLNSHDIRGGTQNGYIAALVWTPVQYLRFNINYAYLDYTGARATAGGRRDYSAQVIGSRFELDF